MATRVVLEAMGFVLSAVSPAVVVPNMIRLEVAGWGVNHGIPTLIMAASSMDDVVAITGFGVALSIAFSKGSLAKALYMGPLEVAAGAAIGLCMGILFWFLPPPGMKCGPSAQIALAIYNKFNGLARRQHKPFTQRKPSQK
ncbi:unnamed protein product [Dibothriocephalus latus]|uniref:Cation/H+ exchanger transmembrane domain-containing protein n=1 Tax=Dibothriocephalus latus TaxID=60516 RepID=A0A3P6TM71_DIBLA|nr:unnamed protein product [Dibothriocephalus latus]